MISTSLFDQNDIKPTRQNDDVSTDYHLTSSVQPPSANLHTVFIHGNNEISILTLGILPTHQRVEQKCEIIQKENQNADSDVASGRNEMGLYPVRKIATDISIAEIG